MSDETELPLLLPYRVGYCIAVNALAQKGGRVGYMYRVRPEERGDSGWRFFRGDESDEEASDPENLGIYDVNTIATIDPAIIRRLHAPHGSAWERGAGRDVFEPTEFPEGDDDEDAEPYDPKHELPIFPIVTGAFDLPGDFRCKLPAYFFIRREDADLVLWRKGLTMRFSFLLAKSLTTTKETALAKNKASRPKQALDEQEEIGPDTIRYSYELPPELDKQGATTLIGNLYTDTQWVLSAYQCTDPEMIPVARAVRASLAQKKA